MCCRGTASSAEQDFSIPGHSLSGAAAFPGRSLLSPCLTWSGVMEMEGVEGSEEVGQTKVDRMRELVVQ